MNVTAPPINQIAEVYQITRQQVWNMRRRLDLRIEDFREPELVFERMLGNRNTSTLRRKLSLPEYRAAIRKQLSKA